MAEQEELRGQIERLMRATMDIRPMTDPEWRETYDQMREDSSVSETLPPFDQFLKERRIEEAKETSTLENRIQAETEEVLKTVLEIRGGDASGPLTRNELFAGRIRRLNAEFAGGLADLRSEIENDIGAEDRPRFQKILEAYEANQADWEGMDGNFTRESFEEMMRRHMERLKDIS